MTGRKRLLGRAALLLGWVVGTGMLTALILAPVTMVDGHRREQANREAFEWLDARLAELGHRAEDAAEQVSALRRSGGFTGPVDGDFDRHGEISRRYVATKSRRVEMERRLMAAGGAGQAREEYDDALAEEEALRTDFDRSMFGKSSSPFESKLRQLERDAKHARQDYESFKKRYQELREQGPSRASYLLPEPWLIGLVACLAATGLALVGRWRSCRF